MKPTKIFASLVAIIFTSNLNFKPTFSFLIVKPGLTGSLQSYSCPKSCLLEQVSQFILKLTNQIKYTS